MPKNYTYSTSRYDLVSPGPADPEEFDKMAGPGSCVAEAVASVTYRSTIPEFWDVFIPQVEALTGIERGVDQVATEKARAKAKDPTSVKDQKEKFTAYDNRVWAQINDEQKAALVALSKKVALEITIDPTPARRAAGPGAIFVQKAESVLAREESALNETVNKLLQSVPGFEIEYDENGKPEKMSLARLIRAWTESV